MKEEDRILIDFERLYPPPAGGRKQYSYQAFINYICDFEQKLLQGTSAAQVGHTHVMSTIV
jgi:hypothetical protein